MTSHAAPAADIVSVLDTRPARLGDCRLICVDGPAGSGKTTLAGQVADALEARGSRIQALHMDDLYEGWAGLQPSLEPRLIAQVIDPLARSQPARWQRYDWHRGVFDEWRDLAPSDYLVLEGCGSGAQAYAPYRSLLVFVEADRATRLRRGIERDGPAVVPEWLRWMDREQAHFDLNRTRERADLLISTQGL